MLVLLRLYCEALGECAAAAGPIKEYLVNKVFGVVLMAALSAALVPAHAQKRYKSGAEGSTACKTFSGAPQISISREGNILLYRGANGADHIYREGYVLCNAGASPRISTNTGDSGFSQASCTCSGNSCSVTRTTADRQLKLTQVLTKSTDRNRTFDITMSVQNVSGFSLGGVILRRLATFDISNSVSEWHDGPLDSASAWGTKQAGIPYAVRLRHIYRTPSTVTYQAKTPSFADNSCSPPDYTASGPVFGDYDSTIEYNLGTMAPGSIKSVSVQYLRD